MKNGEETTSLYQIHITTEKVGRRGYNAMCDRLPGTYTMGTGRTRLEAVAALLLIHADTFAQVIEDARKNRGTWSLKIDNQLWRDRHYAKGQRR